MPAPILCERLNVDDRVLVPVGKRACELFDQTFEPGKRYPIEAALGRSQASHNHYFACMADGWRNLPDHMLELYPTSEHLRKKMLIKCGYADERSIVCSSKAEALRIAAFMKPMDEYAVIVVRETVVRVFIAQSQSKKAMGAKVFQESKQAVLDAIEDLLGADRGTLKGEAA